MVVLFGDLLSSFCYRLFFFRLIDVWRHLTTSLATLVVLYTIYNDATNDVLWRHLTASNTIYNTPTLHVIVRFGVRLLHFTTLNVRFGGRLFLRLVGRLYTYTIFNFSLEARGPIMTEMFDYLKNLSISF